MWDDYVGNARRAAGKPEIGGVPHHPAAGGGGPQVMDYRQAQQQFTPGPMIYERRNQGRGRSSWQLHSMAPQRGGFRGGFRGGPPMMGRGGFRGQGGGPGFRGRGRGGGPGSQGGPPDEDKITVDNEPGPSGEAEEKDADGTNKEEGGGKAKAPVQGNHQARGAPAGPRYQNLLERQKMMYTAIEQRSMKKEERARKDREKIKDTNWMCPECNIANPEWRNTCLNYKTCSQKVPMWFRDMRANKKIAEAWGLNIEGNKNEGVDATGLQPLMGVGTAGDAHTADGGSMKPAIEESLLQHQLERQRKLKPDQLQKQRSARDMQRQAEAEADEQSWSQQQENRRRHGDGAGGSAPIPVIGQAYTPIQNHQDMNNSFAQKHALDRQAELEREYEKMMEEPVVPNQQRQPASSHQQQASVASSYQQAPPPPPQTAYGATPAAQPGQQAMEEGSADNEPIYRTIQKQNRQTLMQKQEEYAKKYIMAGKEERPEIQLVEQPPRQSLPAPVPPPAAVAPPQASPVPIEFKVKLPTTPGFLSWQASLMDYCMVKGWTPPDYMQHKGKDGGFQATAQLVSPNGAMTETSRDLSISPDEAMNQAAHQLLHRLQVIPQGILFGPKRPTFGSPMDHDGQPAAKRSTPTGEPRPAFGPQAPPPQALPSPSAPGMWSEKQVHHVCLARQPGFVSWMESLEKYCRFKNWQLPVYLVNKNAGGGHRATVQLLTPEKSHEIKSDLFKTADEAGNQSAFSLLKQLKMLPRGSKFK